jgi:hypothetical protein
MTDKRGHLFPPPHRRPRLASCSALAVALLVGLALTACGSSRPARPTTLGSASTTTASASTPPTSTPGTTPGTTTAPSSSLGSYQPLFPFATVQDVVAWQQSYVASGQQPWHLDAGQTALAFASWLGYSNIDTAIGVHTDSTGAHVSLGFHTGEPTSQASTSAIVHLVRWGSGSTLPWEVVGTDDTTFSMTNPSYSAIVKSPVKVSGLISGVDESIKLQVRSTSSASAVGTSCCVPAGGNHTPWSETVSFTASPVVVLTIAASTGGHVAAVERFTVTGVRAL